MLSSAVSARLGSAVAVSLPTAGWRRIKPTVDSCVCATGAAAVCAGALDGSTVAIAGAVGWGYIWFRPNGRLSVDEIAEQMATMVMQMVGANPKDYASAMAAN